MNALVILSGLLIVALANSPARAGTRLFLDDFEPALAGLDQRPSNTTCLAASLPTQQLSASGCVAPADPSQPPGGLIPYDLNVPFWSDGAAKQRWLALPDGATIHINPDGDWQLPVGSVLVKHFRLGGKLIETRLLMHRAAGDWVGYSYEWDDAQTDAMLLTGGKTKPIAGQTYTYPSRGQCLQCHTLAAGRTLGLETDQLNRELTYPTTGRQANQLATFAHIGLFDAPMQPPNALPALPRTDDQGIPLALRARAYLHTNCSHCHRPKGLGGGALDFRFTTPAASVGACGVAPLEGDLGIAGARLLQPGDPTLSIISVRSHALDSNKMPPIGRNVVDAAGVALLDAWISSLTGCP